MTGPVEQPAYPIPRPTNDSEARFTNSLTSDLADVLARHGYPPPHTGADPVRLQQAPFTPIYQPTAPGIEENP